MLCCTHMVRGKEAEPGTAKEGRCKTQAIPFSTADTHTYRLIRDLLCGADVTWRP